MDISNTALNYKAKLSCMKVCNIIFLSFYKAKQYSKIFRDPTILFITVGRHIEPYTLGSSVWGFCSDEYFEAEEQFERLSEAVYIQCAWKRVSQSITKPANGG